MKLAHSIPMALFVSMAALVSACGDEPTDDTGTGGSGGTGTGGSATGGSAGAATGGSAGAATGGSAGAATGGSAGAATGGSAGAATGGSAGAATGGSGGSGVSDRPTDSSQAGLEAWLMMNTYTQAGMGFRPEATPSGGTSVHGAVMRYFNETIIASKAAGNTTGSAHTVGSMAVKDLLTGTTVVGKAAMLKTDAGWVYYCKASEDARCFSGSLANTATYATTGGGSCACHGSGTINSSTAIPAP